MNILEFQMQTLSPEQPNFPTLESFSWGIPICKSQCESSFG